jgi:lysophospholipase L1-like esterase
LEEAVLGTDLACRAIKSLAIVGLLAGLVLPVRAELASPKCDAPLDLLRLANPLSRVAYKLSAGAPITIVAIGSSSTAGSGASSVAATYPSRLAAELKQHFPGHSIIMLNRGVGGEEIADMLKRFDKAVIANKPDLVLWQLGTNSVIRDHRVSDRGAAIRKGLKKIRKTGADIILIDPQFAPKVIVKPEAGHMVEFIARIARQEDVALFRRYDVMKRWSEVDHLPFAAFVAADGLHMNDWSYACIAKGLGMAIAEAVQRPIVSAKVIPQQDFDVWP